MLNTFQECPVKYYYKFVKNITAPILESKFLVGKNIHAIAAYYLKGNDISAFELSESENQMWRNLQNVEYFSYAVEAVETMVTANVCGSWVGGRIDALVSKGGHYYILDYKTGKIPVNAKENFQTIVYLMCCDKLLKDYKSLSFVYINVKSSEIEVIKFSKELRQYYEELILKITDKIQKISYQSVKKDKQCNSCVYSKMCI